MPEPMSEERLAEITRGHRNATSRGTFWTADMWIEELLAEVERLKALTDVEQRLKAIRADWQAECK